MCPVSLCRICIQICIPDSCRHCRPKTPVKCGSSLTTFGAGTKARAQGVSALAAALMVNTALRQISLARVPFPTIIIVINSPEAEIFGHLRRASHQFCPPCQVGRMGIPPGRLYCHFFFVHSTKECPQNAGPCQP